MSVMGEKKISISDLLLNSIFRKRDGPTNSQFLLDSRPVVRRVSKTNDGCRVLLYPIQVAFCCEKKN
jgi:hypothetical protein